MDLIFKTMSEAEKQMPQRKQLVGIICSQSTEIKLKQECCSSTLTKKTPHLGLHDYFYGAPIWVDSRMKGDLCEVHYDKKAWKDRTDEQNKYDNQRPATSTQPSFGVD